METAETLVAVDAPTDAFPGPSSEEIVESVPDRTQPIVEEDIQESGVETKTEAAVVEEEKVDQHDDHSKEAVKILENVVTIVIRPVDCEWIMGEDWNVTLPHSSTMLEVKKFIEYARGISRHRMQLRLKGKVLVPSREGWTMRRIGIYDGYVIQVEPTLSGSWYWNPYEYYANKLLDEVCSKVQEAGGRISLTALNELVKCPPIVKTSLRVFLRKYPERIYIHTDTANNYLWIHETQHPFHLPTFGTCPVEIGSIKHFKPAKVDWEAYRDVDDMYKVEKVIVEYDNTAVTPREGGGGGGEGNGDGMKAAEGKEGDETEEKSGEDGEEGALQEEGGVVEEAIDLDAEDAPEEKSAKSVSSIDSTGNVAIS